MEPTPLPPPMRMPKAGATAVARFEELLPRDASVTRRLMFGQPAAFANGRMFLGVFGDTVFVRVSLEDRERARSEAGLAPFDPMGGRPMRDYVVLSEEILSDPEEAERWIASALAASRAAGPRSAPAPRARRSQSRPSSPRKP